MMATYYYVVLRLVPDAMRGELINIGIALFSKDGAARIITMATLNKLRAIDSSWDAKRLAEWSGNVQSIVNSKNKISDQIKALEIFGFCEKESTGMFVADSESTLNERILEIKTKYVSNKDLSLIHI